MQPGQGIEDLLLALQWMEQDAERDYPLVVGQRDGLTIELTFVPIGEAETLGSPGLE